MHSWSRSLSRSSVATPPGNSHRDHHFPDLRDSEVKEELLIRVFGCFSWFSNTLWSSHTRISARSRSRRAAPASPSPLKGQARAVIQHSSFQRCLRILRPELMVHLINCRCHIQSTCCLPVARSTVRCKAACFEGQDSVQSRARHFLVGQGLKSKFRRNCSARADPHR